MKQILGMILLSVLLSAAAYGATPVLKAGTLVYAGSSSLRVPYYSAPEVADWNSDGRKDLLVGTYTNGEIYVYINQGTDAAPVFGASQKVQSAGAPIQMSFY